MQTQFRIEMVDGRWPLSRVMASSCSCIVCGESKEEAESFCKTCYLAMNEIATEEDSFCRTCDSSKIEIASAENSLSVKRKLCPSDSCVVCGQGLDGTSSSSYCSVCDSAMIEIASPESAANSVPPPQVPGSPRRRLQFDEAVGNNTVDLLSPIRLDSSFDLKPEEIVVDLERDSGNRIEQSQESTPGSVCQVLDVLTAEDVISQRFLEAKQKGEIVNLLSQEEIKCPELQ
jgi:hypothetical protein